MIERKVYHVVPAGSDWRVELEGHGGAVGGRYEDKIEAVEAARQLAHKEDLGQVIVHRKDGTIETEYTYHEDPRRFVG